MRFKNRSDAGQLLAQKFKKYITQDVIVYAFPRGGVVTAVEIARYLQAPLDLIITRKISHPLSPEFAIAATDENGHLVGSRTELALVDQDWLEKQIDAERKEAQRRRMKYLHGRKIISPENKIVVLVDDGAATGLTLRVGITELRHKNPKSLIVAVPMVPKSTANLLREEADVLITLIIPADNSFLRSIGAYYDNFEQVSDNEVISILDEHEDWIKKGNALRVYPGLTKRHGDNYVEYDEP